MKIGAWIHTKGVSLEEQIRLAAESGLQAIRSYDIGYAEEAAPALRQMGMSLLAGVHVDSQALLSDWRSQVRLDEVTRYRALGIPLDGICVGNELREGGDEPDKKHFTARLSFALANVLRAYREWLDQQGDATPLTYAMEGIVFDNAGNFHEWLWPLIDACDVVSLNLYPMDAAAWFTFGAFEESRRFMQDTRVRRERLLLFELNLRRALQQLQTVGKLLFFSETGFPSAIGYHMDAGRVAPESDSECFAEAMREFLSLIHRVNADYAGKIQALYFYEWRDNLYHEKIENIEMSPIHSAFGLCDRFGTPKLDIKALVQGNHVP